jgi:hypothetical protein
VTPDLQKKEEKNLINKQSLERQKGQQASIPKKGGGARK